MSEENNTNWSESFPEEVKQWDEVANSQSAEQFWQRIGSHRKHIGQSIRIPSEEASTEDMNAFYDKLQKRAPNLMPVPDQDDPEAVKAVFSRLGLPEEANQYGDIEDDSLQFNEGQLDTLKGLAFNAGLTKSQFESLARQVGTKTAAESLATKEAQEEAQKALKEQWGMTAEDKLKETKTFLERSSAPQNLVDLMAANGVDADTTLWLHKLSEGMGENNEMSNQNNGAGGGNGTLAPYEAQERINEMLNNRQHPYHRGDARARTRMRELMAMANVS